MEEAILLTCIKNNLENHFLVFYLSDRWRQVLLYIYINQIECKS